METACGSRLVRSDNSYLLHKRRGEVVRNRNIEKLGFKAARHFLSTCVVVFTFCAFGSGRANDINVRPGVNKLLIGTQLTYGVQYKSEGYTEIRNAVEMMPEGHSSSRHNLFGSLEAAEILTFLDGDRGVVRASIRFKRPVITIQVDSKSQPAREREIADALEHPAVAYFDAQSRVTRLEFPKEYSPMATNFVKSIITMQQYSVPSNQGHETSMWEMEETGANGRYAAHYQITGESGQLRRVTKTVSRSVSPPASEGANSATTIQIVPKGRIEISVNMDQGVVRQLNGVSHEDMLVQGKVLASQSTTIACHIVSSVRLARIELATAAGMVTIPSGAMDALTRPTHGLTPVQERAMQEQILGSDTVHSLLKQLGDVGIGTTSQEFQTTLYLKLKALVYLHPETSKSLGNRLLTADTTSPSAQMITTALSAVGSPEAQDTLCKTIRAKKAEPRTLRALIPVLGSLNQPTGRVVVLLQELSHSSIGDVRSTALLALGGAAKNLAPMAPKLAAAIVGDLLRQYSSSTTMDERTTLLLSLGNSGSERAESIILTQRDSQSPELRRTACSVLGDLKSSKSLQALCETLRTDQDPQVRSAAAQALGPRCEINVAKDALLRAAQKDVAESVRLASLFALTSLIPTDERVREVARALAERDGSTAVREQAMSLLQRSQPKK